jgi:diacylglycerol kinase family enzyme
LGSGNDFIRIFGDKKDLRNVADHVNGTVMDFDLIKCGDQYAINQCSMGVDAEVCAKQADFKKLPLLSGEAAYTAALLYCFIGRMKSRFTIQIDDEEPFTSDVLFCVAGNSRWYGGGYMAAPKALTYDGLLDFVVVEKNCSRLTLLGLIAPYKRGEHLEWERTHFKRGKKITIKSKKPSAVNFDGEVKIVTEATFNIVEKAIKYVVPENSDFTKKVEEGTL